jgi:hypothetical protein
MLAGVVTSGWVRKEAGWSSESECVSECEEEEEEEDGWAEAEKEAGWAEEDASWGKEEASWAEKETSWGKEEAGWDDDIMASARCLDTTFSLMQLTPSKPKGKALDLECSPATTAAADIAVDNAKYVARLPPVSPPRFLMQVARQLREAAPDFREALPNATERKQAAERLTPIKKKKAAKKDTPMKKKAAKKDTPQKKATFGKAMRRPEKRRVTVEMLQTFAEEAGVPLDAQPQASGARGADQSRRQGEANYTVYAMNGARIQVVVVVIIVIVFYNNGCHIVGNNGTLGDRMYRS